MTLSISNSMISFAALETKVREIKNAPKEKAQAKLDTLFCPDLSKSVTDAQKEIHCLNAD